MIRINLFTGRILAGKKPGIIPIKSGCVTYERDCIRIFTGYKPDCYS